LLPNCFAVNFDGSSSQVILRSGTFSRSRPTFQKGRTFLYS
jgi:hypothetical protein